MTNAIMQNLLALQEIEFGPKASSAASKETAASLRAKIPPNILGHYDRLLARGKKGCAAVTVRQKVCMECHMAVPIGTVITLLKAADIQLCGNCGRYLYAVPEAPEADKPAARKRGRKKKADVPAEVTTPNAA